MRFTRSHRWQSWYFAASCAGLCSPCKPYDVQCLCNTPIGQGRTERGLPGALPCYAASGPFPHFILAPRVRPLATPRSGFAVRLSRSPSSIPSSLRHVLLLCNVFFISHRYAPTPHHLSHRSSSSALSTRCNLGSSASFPLSQSPYSPYSPNMHLITLLLPK